MKKVSTRIGTITARLSDAVFEEIEEVDNHDN